MNSMCLPVIREALRRIDGMHDAGPTMISAWHRCCWRGEAMRASVREDDRPEVVIVASSSETVHGLESYLRASGVAAHGTTDIEELSRLTRPRVVALVLFPDDFRWESVISAVAEASERGPHLLPILVTAHSRRFEQLTGGRIGAPQARKASRRKVDERPHVLIVPRPAWGWTILDVIRAHADR
jgi:hypothetical protein